MTNKSTKNYTDLNQCLCCFSFWWVSETAATFVCVRVCVCESICGGARQLTLIFLVCWQTVSEPGSAPSPVLIRSIVNMCWALSLNYLGKLWNGKWLKERIIMRKQRNGILRHNKTHVRAACWFIVGILCWFFFRAALCPIFNALQKYSRPLKFFIFLSHYSHKFNSVLCVLFGL